MIRCIAIDDEPLALQQIVSYISKTPFLSLVAQCKSASAALEVLHKEDVDLMFVDINMPDITGLELVRSLNKPVMTVFTTAYSEYAIEGFRVDAVDYLLKPIEAEPLKRAVARCRMGGGGVDVEVLLRMLEGGQQRKFTKGYKERYIVRFNDRIVPLQTSNIAYVYSEDKTNYLVTFDDQKYIIDSSLDVITEELNPDVFFRISRSCMGPADA